MECWSTYQPKYQLTLNQYSCQPTLPPRVILVNILSRISTDTQPRVDGVWSTSQLICQPMLCQGVPKLQRSSDLGSTSDWLKEISFAARLIKKHYPVGSDTSSVLNLCSFCRCHIAGKAVVVSQNVGCFLRLQQIPKIKLHV